MNAIHMERAVFAVDRDDPAAWSLVQKLTAEPMKSGRIIPLSRAEYKALHRSVMVLKLPEASTPSGEAGNGNGSTQKELDSAART